MSKPMRRTSISCAIGVFALFAMGCTDPTGQESHVPDNDAKLRAFFLEECEAFQCVGEKNYLDYGLQQRNLHIDRVISIRNQDGQNSNFEVLLGAGGLDYFLLVVARTPNGRFVVLEMHEAQVELP